MIVAHRLVERGCGAAGWMTADGWRTCRLLGMRGGCERVDADAMFTLLAISRGS